MSGWDGKVHNVCEVCVLEEVLRKAGENDPTCGDWEISGDKGRVWVDASSLALETHAQIGGVTIEDMTWLCKDKSEVPLAELDTVLQVLTWLWHGSSTNCNCSPAP